MIVGTGGINFGQWQANSAGNAAKMLQLMFRGQYDTDEISYKVEPSQFLKNSPFEQAVKATPERFQIYLIKTDSHHWQQALMFGKVDPKAYYEMFWKMNPAEGQVVVKGYDESDMEELWKEEADGQARYTVGFPNCQ